MSWGLVSRASIRTLKPPINDCKRFYNGIVDISNSRLDHPSASRQFRKCVHLHKIQTCGHAKTQNPTKAEQAIEQAREIQPPKRSTKTFLNTTSSSAVTKKGQNHDVLLLRARVTFEQSIDPTPVSRNNLVASSPYCRSKQKTTGQNLWPCYDPGVTVLYY